MGWGRGLNTQDEIHDYRAAYAMDFGATPYRLIQQFTDVQPPNSIRMKFRWDVDV